MALGVRPLEPVADPPDRGRGRHAVLEPGHLLAVDEAAEQLGDDRHGGGQGVGGWRAAERLGLHRASQCLSEGLADLVARGEVSAAELLEAAIAVVERLNPTLNAVVHKHYDAVIGHDNEASVREQKRKMGLAPSN